MNKFCGVIGFSNSVEIEDGVWVNKVKEKSYTGEIIKNTFSNVSSGNINDDIQLNCQISIIHDGYLCENLQKILYVSFLGTDWKVTNATPQYPRIILTLGGVYNGPKAETS